ncbi:hypothetical protein AB0K48_06000 [Nonomuraea sp. NPDC055795]
MSQIQQVKQQLHDVAHQSRQAAGGIQAFDVKFSQAVARVQELIGGSATAADKQIIAVLQEASRAVRAAAGSLHSAAKTATDYANRV